MRCPFLGKTPPSLFSSSSSLRGKWVDPDVIYRFQGDVAVAVWAEIQYEMLVASGHASVTGATADGEKPWTCMLMCADVGGEVQGVI